MQQDQRIRGSVAIQRLIQGRSIAPYQANRISRGDQIPDYESADSIIRDIFKGMADLVPNFEERTLTVWLRPQMMRADNDALRHLFTNLTSTGTLFPGTDLRLVYDITG